MANTPGAKKAVRKIARRTEVNTARRSRVRTFLRKFDEALTAGDAAAAKDAFVEGPVGADARRLQGRGAQEHRLAQGLAPGRAAEEDVAPPEPASAGGAIPRLSHRN